MSAPPPDLDALLVHADWLHRLGLQLCRDQQAAADAAQETLLAAATSPPRHGGNLRGYLARALRHVLQLHGRRQRRRLARETAHAAARPSFDLSAAELAERAELHQFLGRCVLELAEPQRALVLMHYFEGAAVAVVAARCGLSEDAVRAHLRRARATLRTRLADDGQPTAQRAFAGLLTTIPTVPAAALLTMTMPIKLLTSAAVAAMVLLLWAPWVARGEAGTPAASTGTATPAQGELPANGSLAADVAARDAAGAVTREPVAATGNLRVRVLWSDGTPGTGVRLIVHPDLDDVQRQCEAVTDAMGEAALQDLPCDSGQLRVDWRGGAPFTVVAGRTTEVLVQMQPGVTVRGIVVDENGLPVPTARIWLSRWGGGEEGLEVGPVAPDGTFVLRDVPTGLSFVAALAPGKRVSTLTVIEGAPGSAQDVRIELREPGVTLIGRVQRPDGSPAIGQRVLVGRRENKAYHRESVWRTARPPVDTTSDERGMFRADGLQPGSLVRVWLRGDDTAPCLHQVQLPESGVFELLVTVTAGATVRGKVTSSGGAPVADVAVLARSEAMFEPKERDRFETAPSFAGVQAQTAADGSYTLQHVPPGAVTLLAKRHQPQPATAEAQRMLRDGDTAGWDPVLTAGTVIQGAIVDSREQPLVGWEVQAQGETAAQWRTATSDARGAFELTDCGDDDWQLTVTAAGGSYKFPNRRLRGIAAGTGNLRIVIPASAMPSATITGRVRFADGTPATHATLWLWREASRSIEVIPDGFDGTFRIGLLPPGVWRAHAQCGERRSPWTDRFVLHEGENDLGTLVIGAAGRVDITVGDAAGAAIDGVDCWILDPIENHDHVVTAGHAKGGRLQLADLRPGDYGVRTMHKDQPRIDVPFTVRADETTAVAVTIPVSIACVLVTKPAQRGGYEHFVFEWTRDGGAAQRDHETISTRGEKRIPRRLLPGDYTLTITAVDGTRSENHFSVAPTDPAGREIPIRLP